MPIPGLTDPFVRAYSDFAPSTPSASQLMDWLRTNNRPEAPFGSPDAANALGGGHAQVPVAGVGGPAPGYSGAYSSSEAQPALSPEAQQKLMARLGLIHQQGPVPLPAAPQDFTQTIMNGPNMSQERFNWDPVSTKWNSQAVVPPGQNANLPQQGLMNPMPGFPSMEEMKKMAYDSYRGPQGQIWNEGSPEGRAGRGQFQDIMGMLHLQNQRMQAQAAMNQSGRRPLDAMIASAKQLYLMEKQKAEDQGLSPEDAHARGLKAQRDFVGGDVDLMRELGLPVPKTGPANGSQPQGSLPPLGVVTGVREAVKGNDINSLLDYLLSNQEKIGGQPGLASVLEQAAPGFGGPPEMRRQAATKLRDIMSQNELESYGPYSLTKGTFGRGLEGPGVSIPTPGWQGMFSTPGRTHAASTSPNDLRKERMRQAQEASFLQRILAASMEK